MLKRYLEPNGNARLSPSDVLRILEEQRPGFSLDAKFYNSQVMYDIEMDLLFGQHWIFIGPSAAVPEPGDYTVVEFGPYSMIVIRDDDMTVRAFHNVCRHRGARMLSGSGTTGNIVCPYHQWTYNGEGNLIHCEDETLDKSCYGLKAIHLRNVFGLLYVCFAERPPEDFAEMETVIGPYLAPHDLDNAKIAAQIDLVEEGNWKITMENNRECYHCGGHPELLASSFAVFGYTEENCPPEKRPVLDRYRVAEGEMIERCRAENLPYEPVEYLDDRATPFLIGRRPIDLAGESMTLDGRAASKKLMGRFTHPKSGRLQLHQQPNAWHHFNADHAITFCVLPISVDRTLVRTSWLVHKDAVEGVDYDVDNLIFLWNTTNRQDLAYVEMAQKGTYNPAYEPGPYSSSELYVRKFLEWYTRQMKVHASERFEKNSLEREIA